MNEGGEAAKDVGLLSAMTIGIGTMIGAGIFVLPSIAFEEAGPAVVLSFLLGGAIALVNALSVSELGTAHPEAGGAYSWVNRALGPLFGSIVGFGDWLGLAFASAFYAIGFGSYLGLFLPLPAIELGAFVLSEQQLGAVVAGVAFVGLNYLGVKGTGRGQTLAVLTLLTILAAFTAISVALVGVGDLEIAETASAETVLPATALVFVSYVGYAKIATVAEEIRNPERNVPLAVVGSVVIVTGIYTALLVAMLGTVSWETLTVGDTAIVAAAGSVLGPVGVAVLGIAGLLATASSTNLSVMSSARISFAMGRDRIVGGWLNEVHPRFGTPYRSIQTTGLVILAFVVFGNLETLARAASALHLVVYGLINVALVVFREIEPGYDPAFSVPLYPLTPIVGVLASFGLVAFMGPTAIGLTALFVGGTVGWYFLYGRTRVEFEGLLSRYVLSRSERLPESAVSAAETAQPESARYTVLVPLANPASETDLIALASALAKQREGRVLVVHIVQVPDQTALGSGSDRLARLDDRSDQLLSAARDDATTFGVPVETHTVFSHRSFEEVFDTARRADANTVVMGWRGRTHLTAGRAEAPLDELTHDLPCDFLVLKDRGFDPAEILVPTAGTGNDALCAEFATLLKREFGSSVTLLHVVDGEGQRDGGRRFLEDWVERHGLSDAELLVDTRGSVEGAIADAAETRTMVLIGATERGLLSRLVDRALVYDVVDEVDCSVLLAERATERSLRERLFG